MKLPGGKADASLVNRRTFVGSASSVLAGTALSRAGWAGESESRRDRDDREHGTEARPKSALDGAMAGYRESIQECAAALRVTERYRDVRNRVPGERCLLAAETMATSIAVPQQRMAGPDLWHWNSHLFKLGLISSDCTYTTLLLDGGRRYRLTCRRGDVKAFLLQMYSHVLGDPESRITGNYEFEQFRANTNGSVEITLSADRVDGNWIPLHRSSRFNFLFARRFFSDLRSDKGDITVEGIDGDWTHDDFSDQLLAERFQQASYILNYLTKQWTIGLYPFYIDTAGGRNKLSYQGGETYADLVGSPSNSYALGLYDCAPDEAIIIEQAVPKSSYWGFQLGDVWSSALDWTHYQTDINMDHAYISRDGRFRAVIAHDDPGIQNWLDPCGRTELVVAGRNYQETGDKIAGPTLTRIKASDIGKHIPSDTPTFSQQRRRQALRLRREGHQMLFDS